MKKHTRSSKYLKYKKVLKCSKELNNLLKAKNQETLNNLIKSAKVCVIDAISEIAKNCLYGNIPLNNCDFQALSKYQNILRELSRKSTSSKRKNIINQNGGFLKLLIAPALSYILPKAFKFIKKQIYGK